MWLFYEKVCIPENWGTVVKPVGQLKNFFFFWNDPFLLCLLSQVFSQFLNNWILLRNERQRSKKKKFSSPRCCIEDVLLASKWGVSTSARPAAWYNTMQEAIQQPANSRDSPSWEGVVYNWRNKVRPFSAVTKLIMAAAHGSTFFLK